MTREEKILNAIKSAAGIKFTYHIELTDSALDEASAAISQLFDEEMIEFSEWSANNDWIKEYAYMERCWRNRNTDRFGTDYKTTAELLQIFKNRYSPDNQ